MAVAAMTSPSHHAQMHILELQIGKMRCISCCTGAAASSKHPISADHTLAWVLSQADACRCHLILASLRSPSGKGGYQIPRGFLFEYITCANYFCEVLAWLSFAIATQTLAVYIFIAAGTAQMVIWAQAKHRSLRKVRHAALQSSSVLAICNLKL